MGGRDHSCEVCGRGGFNDPGVCTCGPELGRPWLLGVHLGDAEPCEDPTGWPEFEITLRFYVASDDPEVVERERKRVFNNTDWAALDLGGAAERDV